MITFAGVQVRNVHSLKYYGRDNWCCGLFIDPVNGGSSSVRKVGSFYQNVRCNISGAYGSILIHCL
jgi:hypothetical protein